MNRTLWDLYECDHGARWSAVTGGAYTVDDGSPCDFSGCAPGHRVHRQGRTDNRSTAHDWFRRPGALEHQCPACGTP